MGDIAEGLINGDFDFYTGEYLGEGQGFPRFAKSHSYSKKRYKETPAEKKIRAIRKEIAIRTKELASEGENENNALTIARTEANEKYGHGWRGF